MRHIHRDSICAGSICYGLNIKTCKSLIENNELLNIAGSVNYLSLPEGSYGYQSRTRHPRTPALIICSPSCRINGIVLMQNKIKQNKYFANIVRDNNQTPSLISSVASLMKIGIHELATPGYVEVQRWNMQALMSSIRSRGPTSGVTAFMALL